MIRLPKFVPDGYLHFVEVQRVIYRSIFDGSKFDDQLRVELASQIGEKREELAKVRRLGFEGLAQGDKRMFDKPQPDISLSTARPPKRVRRPSQDEFADQRAAFLAHELKSLEILARNLDEGSVELTRFLFPVGSRGAPMPDALQNLGIRRKGAVRDMLRHALFERRIIPAFQSEVFGMQEFENSNMWLNDQTFEVAWKSGLARPIDRRGVPQASEGRHLLFERDKTLAEFPQKVSDRDALPKKGKERRAVEFLSQLKAQGILKDKKAVDARNLVEAELGSKLGDSTWWRAWSHIKEE